MKVLRMCVDPELLDYYRDKVKQHNESFSGTHPNSGFDLASPISVQASETFKLDFKVRGAMYQNNMPIGYYLYSRSSIAKTGLRLANNVGIIDSGYRGNIMAYFDVIKNDNVEVHQRLVQICAPDLGPFRIELVDSLDDTERGEGGFGSTGV